MTVREGLELNSECGCCEPGERCRGFCRATTVMERKHLVATELRSLAANLWDVEYRIRVDEDAKLLLEAAKLLDGGQDKTRSKT